ncbi:hypothetical protein [Fodinibius sediminis]|uniref:hypothetical protein n=1 Tax=Fodinibius sediminis TaxID=1214077 RepID=UPI00163DB098|nr:hypothetical protein [Fodinibius sediminis]
MLLALSAWLLSLIFPWWSLAVPAILLGAALGRTGGSSFGTGFLGIGLLWFVQATYIHLANDGLLVTRIADLFSLPHPWLVILITVLVGGLAGGFSTLTGYLLGKVLSQARKTV